MSGCLTRLVIAAVLLLPGTAVGQANADLKRLDAMVGRWRVDVDLKATPLTQAAKASGTEECEWFADRHVVCRSDAKGSAGSYSQMRTFSYTPARKDYAVYAIDSLGTALLANGQVSGDTWTFTTPSAGGLEPDQKTYAPGESIHIDNLLRFFANHGYRVLDEMEIRVEWLLKQPPRR